MELDGYFLDGTPFLNLQVDEIREPIPALVDTGFNGELTLPDILLRDANLMLLGETRCVTADGATVPAQTYAGTLQWFGKARAIRILAVGGAIPLMGMELLQNCRFVMEPARQTLLIEG